MKNLSYKNGIKDGLPICMAYFVVSFTFGLAVSSIGLSPYLATLISATNLTSAGQFAGIQLIASDVLFLEVFFAVFVINIRYLLMGLSLSQNLPERTGTGKRLIMSFFVTDEIFAVANFRGKDLNFRYFMGLSTTPYFAWAIGTLLGGLTNTLLPNRLQLAMGIALYCMFIAIIVPPAKKSKPIMLCILISVGLSCMLYYLPYLKELSVGLRVVISAVIASAVTAVLFPIKESAATLANINNGGGKND